MRKVKLIIPYFLSILILLNVILLLLNTLLDVKIDFIFSFYSLIFGRSFFSTFYPFIVGGIAGFILLFYEKRWFKIVGMLGVLIAALFIVAAFNLEI